VVVVVVDAGALERGLYLVLQIVETGVPVVVALNMIDEASAGGADFDTLRLAGWLGATVVPTIASRGKRLDALRERPCGRDASWSSGMWRGRGSLARWSKRCRPSSGHWSPPVLEPLEPTDVRGRPGRSYRSNRATLRVLVSRSRFTRRSRRSDTGPPKNSVTSTRRSSALGTDGLRRSSGKSGR